MDSRRYEIDGTENPTGPYSWPTLRSKLRGAVCIWCGWSRPWFAFEWGPNPYHGRYWSLTLGPWLLLGGCVEIAA